VVNELADLTGESLTSAITAAVREKLERVKSGQTRRTGRAVGADRERGRTSVQGAVPRSLEHGEMLYDEKGLPK
jgi:antitoxin VapB